MHRLPVSLQLLLLCVFNKRRLLFIPLIVIALVIIWILIARSQIKNMMMADEFSKEFSGMPSYIKYFDFGHFVDSNRRNSEKSSICVDATVEVCLCYMAILSLRHNSCTFRYNLSISLIQYITNYSLGKYYTFDCNYRRI